MKRGLTSNSPSAGGAFRALAPAARLFAGFALALSWAHAAAQVAPANITPEQLEMLRNLPPEQRDALIESVLGSGSAPASATDRRLQFPETVAPRDPLQSRMPFGEEQEQLRFKAEDTLLLSLRLREFVGSSRVDLQACKLEYSIVSPK